MTITYDELVQLLGGATPVGIQCVYTVQDEDETFEVCEQREANHISAYLRIENGEVVPVRDFPGNGDDAKALASDVVRQVRQLLGELPLESHGALS